MNGPFTVVGCYAKTSRKRRLALSAESINIQNFPPKYSNMAASDVSSKLSNLNLGEDNNEMERPKHFWNRALPAMKFNFEPNWLDATWKAEQKPNFGMRNLH
jgi:hypothetical protein